MWIISKLYGLSNANKMVRIEADKVACQIYGVFADGDRVPICDDEREFDRIIDGLKDDLSFVEVP